jgi:exodeoxyribonuclease VII large subunit
VLPAASRQRLAAASARLAALSPLGVLARGYAIVRGPDGRVLTAAASVAPGDRIDVALARGRLGCEVREVQAGDDPAAGDEPDAES